MSGRMLSLTLICLKGLWAISCKLWIRSLLWYTTTQKPYVAEHLMSVDWLWSKGIVLATLLILIAHNIYLHALIVNRIQSCVSFWDFYMVWCLKFHGGQRTARAHLFIRCVCNILLQYIWHLVAIVSKEWSLWMSSKSKSACELYVSSYSSIM